MYIIYVYMCSRSVGLKFKSSSTFTYKLNIFYMLIVFDIIILLLVRILYVAFFFLCRELLPNVRAYMHMMAMVFVNESTELFG